MINCHKQLHVLHPIQIGILVLDEQISPRGSSLLCQVLSADLCGRELSSLERGSRVHCFHTTRTLANVKDNRRVKFQCIIITVCRIQTNSIK